MDLGLRGHLVTIYRHWIKISLVVLGAFFVAGAIAFLSSKVYVAETRILILTRSPAARATSTNFTDNSQNSSPQEQVLTQVAILESPLLASKLADTLGPQRVMEMMTWKWDWLFALPGKWKNQTVLALYQSSFTHDLIAATGIKKPTKETGPPTAEQAAEKISDNLHVEAILKTDMFGVALATPDAGFSAEALNILIDLYTDHVVALSRPVRTAEIAQSEVDRLERELKAAETRLRNYSKTNRILSLEKQKNLLLDRMERGREEVTKSQREVLETTSKVASITSQISQLPSAESVSVTTVANPLVDRLHEQLAKLETELRQFVPRSLAANKIQIEITGIKAQLASAQTAVRGSETVGVSGLYQQLKGMLVLEQAELLAQKIRVDFLTRQSAEVEGELFRLDALALRYHELRRIAQAKEEAFRYALQKREETAIADQLSGGSSLSQVVQVEPATEPSKSSAPRRMKLLAIGLVVGSMVGIMLAYLLEFSRRTMLTSDEAETALGLPVLASQQITGLIRRHNRANNTEIRRFASLLMRNRTGGKPETLMLISPDNHSEKPKVSAAILDVLSEQGANVMSVRLALINRVGNEPLLTLKGADGNTVRDPGELTLGDTNNPRRDMALIKAPAGRIFDELSSLLKSRSRMYDVILIDSPTLLKFPEARLLVSLVDSILPVVEANHSKISDVTYVIDQFNDIGADVPGIIMTRLRHTRSSWAFCWMSMMRLKSAGQKYGQKNDALL